MTPEEEAVEKAQGEKPAEPVAPDPPEPMSLAAADVGPSPSDMISKANDAAARLEKANERMDALLTRQERLAVERTLGGATEAGTPEKTKEQKEIEDANAMLKGTGLELDGEDGSTN